MNPYMFYAIGVGIAGALGFGGYKVGEEVGKAVAGVVPIAAAGVAVYAIYQTAKS